MSNNFIPVPSATAGYNIRTQDMAVSATTVHVHYMIPMGEGGNVAETLNSAPTAANYGLIVRNLPSGTQTVDASGFTIPITGTASISGTVAITGTVSTSGTVNVSGTVKVSGIVGAHVATASSAVPLFAGLMGGTDGTNIFGIRANASGVMDIQGIATSNSAIPLRVMYTGGNDGTNIRAFKVDTAGVGAVTASVNNAISGIVSTSGTVSCSVNNAISGIVSTSGTVSCSVNNAVSGIVSVSGTVQTKAEATSTSAIPLFAHMMGLSDGTNLFPGIAITTGIVGSANTQTRGVLAAGPLVQWVRAASASTNSACIVTRTAITGAYNVIVGYSWSHGCGTASSVMSSIQVTHGATGTAAVFAQHSGRCPASDSRHYVANNLNWVASLFTAVGVEFPSTGSVSGYAAATIWGYTLPS